MAIAPDETELLELEANSAIGLLDSDEASAADETLWQKDCATAMSSELQQSEENRRIAAGRNIPVIFWLVFLHAGALAAPFFFSWEAFAVCMGLYWFSGSIGVCMGYHRLLTHGSFKVHKPTRWALAFIGGLSGEGCALDWVANHRKHHAHSDHDGDPHCSGVSDSCDDDGGWDSLRPGHVRFTAVSPGVPGAGDRLRIKADCLDERLGFLGHHSHERHDRRRRPEVCDANDDADGSGGARCHHYRCDAVSAGVTD